MLPCLDLDIHQHIIAFLDIRDSISLLLTSSALYYTRFLWHDTIRKTAKLVPLACPPKTNLIELDFRALRKIGYRTSALVQNLWDHPDTPCVPTSLRKFDVPAVTWGDLITVIPGTSIALLRTLGSLTCWDIQQHRRIGSVRMRGLFPYHGWMFSRPCIDQPGIFQMGLITFLPEHFCLVIVQVDFTDREQSPALQKVCQLTVLVPTDYQHCFQFAVNISANIVTVLFVKFAEPEGLVGTLDLTSPVESLDLREGHPIIFSEHSVSNFRGFMTRNDRLHVLFATDSHIFLHPLPSSNKYLLDDEVIKIKLSSSQISDSAEYNGVSPDTKTLISFEQFRPHPSRRPTVGLFVPEAHDQTDQDGTEVTYVRRELQLPKELKPVINSSPRDIVFDDHLGILYWQKGKYIYVISYGLPQEPTIPMITISDLVSRALTTKQHPLFVYLPLELTLKGCVIYGFIYDVVYSRLAHAFGWFIFGLLVQYAKYRIERNHREVWWT